VSPAVVGVTVIVCDPADGLKHRQFCERDVNEFAVARMTLAHVPPPPVTLTVIGDVPELSYTFKQRISVSPAVIVFVKVTAPDAVLFTTGVPTRVIAMRRFPR
jgi:hypothetical protein